TRPRTSTSRSSARRRGRNSRDSAHPRGAARPRRRAEAASAGRSKPWRSAPRRSWRRPRPSTSRGNSRELIPDVLNPIHQTNLRARLMSTSTPEDLLPHADVVELEPPMQGDRAELWAESASGSYQPGPAVALVEGSLVSFTSETDTLRRKRLFAA